MAGPRVHSNYLWHARYRAAGWAALVAGAALGGLLVYASPQVGGDTEEQATILVQDALAVLGGAGLGRLLVGLVRRLHVGRAPE